MATSSSINNRIRSMVESDRVVLFMKGTKNFPQCGFSATVVQILSGMLDDYTTVNVLDDPEVRQGIKDYSSWPTIPQLYVDGTFVGGCDIVKEMFAAGELQKTLGIDPASITPPSITITEAAAEAIRGALQDAQAGDALHLSVSPSFEHSLGIGPAEPGTLEVEAGSLVLRVDPASAKRAEGLVIDFEKDAGGFRIDNPNRPPDVVPLGPAELKAKLESGEIRELVDVRTPDERERAKLEGSVLLDDATMSRIEELDLETPIAFYCHHGTRSLQAAEHFRARGFRRVYNLRGGIDAWSQEVDSSVPRY